MKNKSIILCAGRGSRLNPITNSTPKSMVNICGLPLLERQVNVLRFCGVTDITVIAGYRANKITVDGINILENPEYEHTNMVWSLFLAKSLFDGSSDLIISYGDIVYEPSVLEKLLSTKSELSVTADQNWKALWSLRMDNPMDDVETFKINSDGTIKELGKKPKNEGEVQGQYMGLIKVSASIAPTVLMEYLSMDRNIFYDGQPFKNLYMTSFIQYLISKGNNFNTVFVNGGWLEVDSVADLNVYEKSEAQGILKNICNLHVTEN